MKKLFGSKQSSAPQQPVAVTTMPRIAAGPPAVQHVSAAVGWCCAADVLDYPYILQLAEYISLSKDRSAEAARAIRKELKYAEPAQQENALRLMGILMRNADIRFRQEIASRKFLTQVEQVATNKKTAPTVLLMLHRVLSALAWDCQRDADLSTITGLYNKIKPIDAPVNGAPLDPDDDLLTPTIDPRRRQNGHGRRADVVQMVQQASEHDKHRLTAQADVSRGDARMLSDTLAHIPLDEVESNEIVREFWTKCMQAQDIISSNLEWASSQATQSRERQSENGERAQEQPVEDTTAPASPGRNLRLSSNNPFATVIAAEETETEEEKLFHSLLSAHTEILDALKMYDDRLAMKRERDQLAAVQERSKEETRFDRAANGLPDEHGDYHSDEARHHDQQQHHYNSPEQSPGQNNPYSHLDVLADRFGGAPSSSRGPSPVPHQFASSAGDHNSDEASLRAVSNERRGPPPQTVQAHDFAATQAQESRNPYAAYLAYDRQHQQASSPPRASDDPYGGYSVDEPDPSTARRVLSTPSRRAGPATASANPFMSAADEYADGPNTPVTPTEPSDKALGKMRRLTINDTSDEQRQFELEQQLRDKYKRV